MRERSICLIWALLAVAAAVVWQSGMVYLVYSGHWSGLFCVGERAQLPPELADSYRFPGYGYDGQFYRVLAHHPLLGPAYRQYVDSPLVRSRRILLPAMAFLMAGGRQGAIDAAYIVLVFAFTGLGVYWSSRLAMSYGRHPAWGLVYLLVPSTLIALDRMVLDGVLGTLCVGFLWYWRRSSTAGLLVIAVLAPLCRETGGLLTLSACLFALFERRWWRAFLFAAAAVPALAWFALMRMLNPAMGGAQLAADWLFRYPVLGIFMKMFQPVQYPLSPGWNSFMHVWDDVSLAAVLIALGFCVREVRRAFTDLRSLAAVLFALLVVAVSTPGFWLDVNGWARPISPLFILVAVPLLKGGSWWRIAPLLLADSRLGVYYVSKMLQALHTLTH